MDRQKRLFRLSLFGISVLLGVMLTIQYSVAHRPKQTITQDYLSLKTQVQVELEKQKRIEESIQKTQQQLDEFKRSKGNTAQMKTVMENELSKSRQEAGLTPVSGSGLRIIISDQPSFQVGHPATIAVFNAQALEMIINYLFSNGAQAIAINHQRLVTTSSIRQVGGITDTVGSIQVNAVPIAAPYEIDAIGNITQMEAVLTVNKVVEDLALMGKVATIYQETKKDGITLPAYNGLLPGRYAKQEDAKK
ncbi:DUF881 domain-containing protein [Fodinisporobacter ferrooxydans]|uniref:DUF881 domain-containing protein n=1 Tax=Fodinisporobacter ferrooxydans TaxID=2901836 RepID=A0ABY4CIB7_9BACL|nr:DUF881 domain-containing protein [Alicyclobacillaceae bacterium MYW30-H2]